MEWATDRDGIRRFSHIEIEICSHCDCRCWGCDRFIDTCPTGPMSVDQIRRFVNESLALDWNWQRIHVLGGEPTLHREFRQIVVELLRYKAQYPDTLLRVISNGQGKLAEHRGWLTERGVLIAVEAKKPGGMPSWFVNVRQAPIDEDPTIDPVSPVTCGISGVRGCGIGFTKHGYFLCGAGASVARVIGADCGLQRLEDLTFAATMEQGKILCRVCGHWTGPKRRPKKVADTGQVVSAYWEAMLRDWKPQPMSLYSETV